MLTLRNFCLLSFIFSVMIWSCKDETENPASLNYTIIAKGLLSSTNGIRNGTISNYNSTSKELINIPFSIGKEFGITDVNVLDDYMYVSTYGGAGSTLKKIDLKTGVEAGSVNMEKGTSSTYYYSAPFVDVSADKIIVSSVVEDYPRQERMLLVSKIYSKDLVLIDSVVQSQIGIRVYDTEVVGNKLIYSVLTETNSSFIYQLDLNTMQFLSPYSLSSRVIEILKDEEENLMFFSSHKIVFADPQTFKTIRTVENGIINPNAGQPSFALDKKNDVLYCLNEAAQPSAVTFYIYSLNLSSNQASSSILNQMMESVGSPLIYEEKSERIVTGLPGGLKFYSKEGKIVDQVTLPSGNYKLFVR